MDIIAADTKIPQLGLGTWQLTGQNCREVVAGALRMGYRHIDTAQMYGNEAAVGAGIVDSGVPRDQIWLTTKLNNGNHAPDDVRRTAEDSLRKLGTDHVDLFLIHWPVEIGMLEDTLEAMEKLRKDGMVRHLGVSNFTAEQVNRAADATTIVTNQVEYHPFLDQSALLGLSEDRGMALTAYSPLAQGQVLDDPIISEIAKGRGATPAQVALRWLLDQDHVIAIPRSSSIGHVRGNFAAANMDPLTDDERAAIDGLPKDRRLIDPPFAPDWD